MDWLSNSPLVIGLVSAILGGMVTLVPWLYERKKNKDIIQDTLGLAFLATNSSYIRMAYSTEKKNLVDIEIECHSFEETECWLKFNRGSRTDVLAHGLRHGTFRVIVRDLVPGVTYYFRPEARLNGRDVPGPLSSIPIPNINDPKIRSEAESAPNWLPTIPK